MSPNFDLPWHAVFSLKGLGCAGGTPFTFIAMSGHLSSSQTVVCQGRCVKAYFLSSRAKHITVFFTHGGHGEKLLPSLSDVATLAKQRARTSNLILMGDMNVDILPTYSRDPFASTAGRHHRHADERLQSITFLGTFGLKLHDIESISGNLPAFSQFSLLAPIARMPPWGANAFPSCIDHTTSDGCISLVRASVPDLVIMPALVPVLRWATTFCHGGVEVHRCSPSLRSGPAQFSREHRWSFRPHSSNQ